MSGHGSAVVHEVRGGFCRVCGELEEYLLETGAVVASLDDALIDIAGEPVGI